MTINQISGAIVDSALKVHKTIGPGLLESAYEHCLAHELQTRGFTVQRQLMVPIRYGNIVIDAGYRLDLLVNDVVIVEVKTVERLQRIHEAQLLSHLRMSDHKVGLLINFHVRFLKDGIKRMVNNWETPAAVDR